MIARRRSVRCVLCGTHNAHPEDPDWACSGYEPFCWSCGTYLTREGNRWGWSAARALEIHRAREARIDAVIAGFAG